MMANSRNLFGSKNCTRRPQTQVEQLKISDNKSDKLYDVLKGGTEKLKTSVNLWTARLKYHLTSGEEEQGLKVFKEAVAELTDKALPVWKLMLQYWQNTRPSKVEELFKEGIMQGGPSIANPLKPMFLEWLVLNRGIVAARKQYMVYSQLPPFCLEVHTKMLELEDMQPSPNLKHMRKCHQNTTMQFGAYNTDVWMAYVRFEQNLGDKGNVTDIYSKAIRSLKQPALVDIFISEFSLCKAESFTTPQLITKLDPVDEPMET
ncbi:hypothetical protein AAG570_013783 [Ranatra chinensis]|uniref:U3 small nucleolar RNA-associated protein 6 homolog C-terminal domain-containing protein n=1 Tax=Ranatra chinensis TaxID=642074 RepID=A0ABD0Z1F4_9HEMI